jgi:hypothetical protein
MPPARAELSWGAGFGEYIGVPSSVYPIIGFCVKSVNGLGSVGNGSAAFSGRARNVGVGAP